MQRKFILTAAILGCLSVIIGAWAAHGIHNFIPDVDTQKLAKIASFKVGVRYQFYHTFLLLFLGLIPATQFTKILKKTYWLILIGVILFSGSIYLLALREQIGIADFKSVLGPITPIGGLLLIIGWGSLIIYGLKIKK